MSSSTVKNQTDDTERVPFTMDEVRALVRNRSRGSVSLYMGNYITSEDMEDMRKQVLGKRATDSK